MARVLLIGGTSHAGKSTLARAVAERMQCRCVSTDSLARHPGRPWQVAPHLVPAHVVEHYRDLEPNELIASVLAHYNAMWNPLILPLIHGDTDLVLEGSALLPAKVASVLSDDLKAVWLIASDDLIDHRIRSESNYASLSQAGQFLVSKFSQRAILFNRIMADEVKRLLLPSISVNSDEDVLELSMQVIAP